MLELLNTDERENPREPDADSLTDARMKARSLAGRKQNNYFGREGEEKRTAGNCGILLQSNPLNGSALELKKQGPDLIDLRQSLDGRLVR